MKGKIILIEGVDCSGKATQARLLFEKLRSENIPVETMSFPRYDTPTGRIIGGPYLGKEEISRSWFPEGANAVDPKVASLYYAADRRQALPEIEKIIDAGSNLILDRYVSSNMGHQGGKIEGEEEREKFFNWLDSLEYELMGLPRPDMTFLLYMPWQKSMELKKGRAGNADGHESNPDHLKNAEIAYRHLARLYNWEIIDCCESNKLLTPDVIHQKIFTVFNSKFQ
jgi:thymidylate kinase